MPPTVPDWRFTRETDRTWRWRALGTVSAPFVTCEAAMEDAAQCGFDPPSCYWTVTLSARTTHYRPGRIPINLPDTVQPDE